MELNLIAKEIKYKFHLSEIGSIKFTQREIDVIACIIHFRAEKKIGKFLNISPRTVGAHVRNIMVKIGCNNKDQIVDFVESTEDFQKFGRYYACLYINSYFEVCLKKIAIILARNGDNEKKFFLDKITETKKVYSKLFQQHMKILGLKFSDTPHSSDNHFSASLADFNIKNRSYYQMFFQIISRINSSKEVNVVEREFYKEYHKYEKDTVIDSSRNTGSIRVFSPEASQLNMDIKFFKKTYFVILAALVFLVVMLIYIQDRIIFSEDRTVISDLPNIYGEVYLERPNIEKQLVQRLKVGNNIDMAILVGPGGSGKTTIARHYANQSNADIKWIFPAHSKKALQASYEQLAQELSITAGDQAIITQLLQIKNSFRRNRKIVNYIRSRLAKFKEWIFIYDDVRTFSQIKDTFPFEEGEWGDGKVIITTRNMKFHTNSNFSSSELVKIEPLTYGEKIALFAKIVDEEDNNDPISKHLYREFLRRIPPYPVDVVIAANYIKEERISPDRYIEYLKKNEPNFIKVQRNILEDLTDYEQTRYDIVALSAKEILEINPDFLDLMLVISMINSEEIPISLLLAVSDEIDVREFLNELYKTSLIESETKDRKNLLKQFSIHKYTQAALQTFLQREFESKKSAERLQKLADSFHEHLIDLRSSNKYQDIGLTMGHLEKFYNILEESNDNSWIDTHKIMVDLYSYIGKYSLAAQKIKPVIHFYEEEFGGTHLKTVEWQVLLGIIYKNSAKFELAEQILEEAYAKTLESEKWDKKQRAWIMMYLGSVYRNRGKYVQSIEILEHASELMIELDMENDIEFYRCKFYLGTTYKALHQYDKAEMLMVEAYQFYLRHYGANNVRTKWVKGRIATVYLETARIDKAYKLLQSNLDFYIENLGSESCRVAWTFGQLAKIYLVNGNAKKAEECLTKSMSIYSQNIEDKNNIIFGRLKYNLGRTYLALKNYEKSFKFLDHSHQIYVDYFGEGHVKTTKIIKLKDQVRQFQEHGNSEAVKNT